MPLYLSRWVWDTAGPTGPCWRAPSGTNGAIDLRPLSAQGTAGGTADGWGLFNFATAQAGLAADLVADTLDDNLNVTRRTAWRNRLGIAEAIGNVPLRSILAQTLGNLSDPACTVRAKPVMPDRDGRLVIRIGAAIALDREFEGASDAHWARVQTVEQDDYRAIRVRSLALAQAIENATQGDGSVAARMVTLFAVRHGVTFATAQATLAQRAREKFKRYLGALVLKYRRWAIARTAFIPGDLADEGELPPQTVITESFDTGAPTGTLGPDLTWTKYGIGFQVGFASPNRVNHGHDSLGRARAESDLSSSDHYSQFVLHSHPSGAVLGVAARFNSANEECYTAHSFMTDYYIQKSSTGGVGTNIAGPTPITFALPEIFKLECSGSTISAYQAGVLRNSVTDTTISGNTRAGMIGFGIGPYADDFEAGDGLGGGGGNRRRRMILTTA
jgi:hypothetical protein